MHAAATSFSVPSDRFWQLMDRAYEDNETRQLTLDFGCVPVVPPKSNRLEPWLYEDGDVPEANRGRETLSQAERVSAHLLQIQKARPHIHRLHSLRPHR